MGVKYLELHGCEAFWSGAQPVGILIAGGGQKVAKTAQECLKTLKLLHGAGEIDRAALLSARGRVLSAENDAEREEIVRNLIRNVGNRHKSTRKAAGT